MGEVMDCIEQARKYSIDTDNARKCFFGEIEKMCIKCVKTEVKREECICIHCGRPATELWANGDGTLRPECPNCPEDE